MAPKQNSEKALREYYRTLHGAWGPQHWWPARTRFEVVAGAFLTQNTSWNNVEKALKRLRSARRLSIGGIREIPTSELEELVRPAGYFRQKAARLKTFVAFLDEHHSGSLRRMFASSTEKLREELLGLNGVGPETADSILLYAGQHPIFVVDAYTRRILDRHGILPEEAPYDDIRLLVERSLADMPPVPVRPIGAGDSLLGAAHKPSRMSLAKRSALAQRYNEMHGLIVGVGKQFCLKSKPRCEACPLRRFLPG